MREIKKENFKVTDWSGGQTTELYILPEGADFHDRDFNFRISSASFTSTSSNFSDFSGYQRYILPLKGFIKLEHKGLYNRDLKPFEVEYFDGRWSTYSENSLDTIDFNFIVKSGSVATMEIVSEKTDIKADGYTLYVYSPKDFSVEENGEEKSLTGGNLYIFDTDIKILDLNEKIVISKYKK